MTGNVIDFGLRNADFGSVHTPSPCPLPVGGEGLGEGGL